MFVLAPQQPFFFIRSIICGAPLIQDFDRVGDYFVMDVADHSGDLFLRCKEILKGNDSQFYTPYLTSYLSTKAH